MFGPGISENITLDMQQVAPRAVPTVLAMWLVIINPVAKIALTLAPVAMAVEVWQVADSKSATGLEPCLLAGVGYYGGAL
jgi:hypothetical protein